MAHKDGFTNATRRPYIRRWLQGKALHPLDIAVALRWYDEQPEGFRDDPAVAKIADESHEKMCGKYEQKPPIPIKIIRDISSSWKLFVLVMAANTISFYLYSIREAIWALVQIQ